MPLSHPLARAVPIMIMLAGPLAGCTALRDIVPDLPVAPKYKGLAGQSVAVAVWADRPVRVDFPAIQLDLANQLQNILAAEAKDGSGDVKETKFPVEPRSVVKYQRDHPELEGEDAAVLATKVGTTRLIYIEITDLSTRADAGVDLFLGNATATMRVIEVGPDGKATTAYREDNLKVTYPKKAPPSGVPSSDDNRIYQGTTAAMAREVADRLLTHSGEQ
jgi:hypothetical protein